MEIFALADNSLQANLRTDFNPYETYKTRLVRVDLARRNGPRDVLRHSFRKGLRYFWFFIRLKGFEIPTPSTYASATALEANLKRTYQKTACIAEYMTRFVVALLAGAFLVVPLIVMSYQPSNQAHLITISICIFVFSLLVSLVSKASNEQIMIAAAGYAAVLAVFLSNTPAA